MSPEGSAGYSAGGEPGADYLSSPLCLEEEQDVCEAVDGRRLLGFTLCFGIVCIVSSCV